MVSNVYFGLPQSADDQVFMYAKLISDLKNLSLVLQCLGNFSSCVFFSVVTNFILDWLKLYAQLF